MPILKVMDFSGTYRTKTNEKTGEVSVYVPLSGGKDWRVSQQKLSLMMAAAAILRHDHPVTLRRLYYMLFGAGWIDNSQKTYSSIVIPAMLEARQRGIIPWAHIIDTTRPPHSIPMWLSPRDFLNDAPHWYKRDIWKDQKVYIEVWVEKRADMGHVMAAAHPYCITVNAGNGYDGWSSIHEASLRLREHEQAGRVCHILYLGDYDPSGLHMAYSLEERLRTFGVKPVFDRLGVNRDDIDEHELPEWPGKESDPRADWMMEQYGELIQVEMDALPTPTLQEKVEQAIESLLDMEVFEATKARNEKETEALQEALKKVRISIDEGEGQPPSPKERKERKEPDDDWTPDGPSPWG